MLLDGDIFLYMVTTSNEEVIDWGDDMFTLHSDFKQCRDKLADTITYYQNILLCKHIAIALTHSKNFRKKILPEYKFNRKNLRKPVCYKALREWLKENYKCYEKPYLEGDDCLGILATSDIIKGDKIVVSKDKDLKTIPAQHYVITNQGQYLDINELEADYWHMHQTLTGDSSDNYKGCKNIGTVTATKILDGLKTKKEMWEAVVAQYKKQKQTKKDALIQARVARICRASDYNFKRKRPILWCPDA
jgi:DNA polymerase-1|tara:strand:- start:67 stop:807 length:741 start_codon:yes stop_codon:yes gene_type:complete